MKLVFLNATRVDLGWHQMSRFFWHPLFVSLVLALSAIVMTLRPYDDLVHFDVIRMTLFYANSVIGFVFLLVSLVYVTQRLGLVVYSFPSLAAAVTGATIYGMYSAMLLGAARPAPQDILLVILFNLVFAVLGEVILASFLLNRILQDLGLRPGPEPKAEAALVPAPAPGEAPEDEIVVKVFGQEFLSREVVALTAEAHYVAVHLTSQQKRLLRGRISEAVKAMPDGFGLLIHRSSFVTARAADRIDLDGRQTVLVLTNGMRLPIARNRIQETRDWLSGIQAKQKAP